MTKRTSFLAASIFLVAGAIAASAGYWNNSFPKVGGSSFSCGSVNGVSNCTVPAGPAALTGNETFPADTNLSGGRNPQTVQVPINLLQISGIAQVVTTNADVTIGAGVGTLISNQGVATIAAITLPAAPADNQVVRIVNAGSGALTITAINANTGQSIVGGAAPASLALQTNNASAAALSSVAYMYRASNATWYRIM